MSRDEKKQYLRLIYAQTFRWFGICLALCALVGGAYGDRMYTVWALCTAGSILICWGWFIYLRLDGMRIFGFKPNPDSRKVPYIHRRFKNAHPHRPAFRKDSTDFDDDLNSATAVDAERFSERAQEIARIWARVAAGILLFALSFFF